MAVRPVEFQGMIQNTHELSQARNAEQQRPHIQQDQAMLANHQNVQTQATTVSESKQSATDTFDSSEGDGTGYMGNRGNRNKKEKEKKKKVLDGAIIKKNNYGSFNAEV